MRKVNLLRCDIARDDSLQNLFTDLSEMRFALSQAYARFNSAVDPDLVDACIFEINAAQSRCNYLLRIIKERGGEAEYRTCSEGVCTWI